MIAHLVLQGNRLEALGNILQQAKGSCDILNSGQAPPSSPKKKVCYAAFRIFSRVHVVYTVFLHVLYGYHCALYNCVNPLSYRCVLHSKHLFNDVSVLHTRAPSTCPYKQRLKTAVIFRVFFDRHHVLTATFFSSVKVCLQTKGGHVEDSKHLVIVVFSFFNAQ